MDDADDYIKAILKGLRDAGLTRMPSREAMLDLWRFQYLPEIAILWWVEEGQ